MSFFIYHYHYTLVGVDRFSRWRPKNVSKICKLLREGVNFQGYLYALGFLFMYNGSHIYHRIPTYLPYIHTYCRLVRDQIIILPILRYFYCIVHQPTVCTHFWIERPSRGRSMYYAEEIQAPEVIERGIVDCRRHSNKTTWASIRAVQLEVYILQLEPQEEAKCAEHNLNKNTKHIGCIQVTMRAKESPSIRSEISGWCWWRHGKRIAEQMKKQGTKNQCILFTRRVIMVWHVDILRGSMR